MITTAPLLSGSILDEEIALELYAVDEGVKRYNRLVSDAIRRGSGAELKPAERLALAWFEPLKVLVEARIGDAKVGKIAAKNDTFEKWGPVLRLVDADRVAYCTINRAVGACMMKREGVPLTSVCYEIGNAIVAEANNDVLMHDHRDEFEALSRRVRDLNPFRVNRWARVSLADSHWSRFICTHMGAWAVQSLVSVALANDRPAFAIDKRHNGKDYRASTLSMSDAALDLVEQGHMGRQHLRPRYQPMIVTPYPWVQFKDDRGGHTIEGGYAKIRTPYISKPTREQKDALRHADLTHLNECRTDLESTAWRVNARVLKVAQDLHAQGGSVCDIPPREDRPLPERPDPFEGEAKVQWKKAASEVHRQNIKDASARSSFLQTIDTAERFKDRDSFYFPHQFDFRGRCYPIPPALNHHGDDFRRGLLEFAEAKVPGPEGDRELLIEAANAYGMDKLSYDDRATWTLDHLQQVSRSALDPLGDEWWHTAKKPWQFLATIMALFDKEAAAHAPVRRDGTCNGLQHYVALARDESAAAAVNLVPGDKPASIYNDVAAAVRPLVAADAECSDRVLSYRDFRTKTNATVAVRDLAAALLPLIGKDTVKGPVMITVYGAKHVGTRRSIQDALKELGFDAKVRYIAARYLAERVLEGLGAACAGASAIMEWLRECAGLIVKTGQTVRWTTPMGLPVVQPYRQVKRASVKTVCGTLNLRIREDWLPINTSKQINGVPPNFIHPIDAAHMLTTARECRRAGVTFAAVHDQYWGHAADEGRRARISRERFVALHERDILGDLRAQWQRTYQDIDFPEPPPRGTLDISQVLDSPYFFS